MSEVVVDCIALMDDGKRGFFTLMPHEKALEIQNNGGLANAENITFRETSERPIPQEVKEGLSCITEVFVRLEPNMMVYLN